MKWEIKTVTLYELSPNEEKKNNTNDIDFNSLLDGEYNRSMFEIVLWWRHLLFMGEDLCSSLVKSFLVGEELCSSLMKIFHFEDLPPWRSSRIGWTPTANPLISPSPLLKFQIIIQIIFPIFLGKFRGGDIFISYKVNADREVSFQVTQFTTKPHPLSNGFISEVRDGIVPMARWMKNTIDWSLNLELSGGQAQC